MSTTPENGFTGQARRVSGAVADLLFLRYELFGLEAREEKSRVVGLLVSTIIACFAGFMAFLCLNVFLIVRFWEDRMVLCGALAVAYALLAIGLWFYVRRRLHKDPPPFAATIEELRKDVTLFGSKGSGRESGR